MKTNLKTKQGGFTLIELLVVISIIGILSAIVFASLQKTRESAQNAYNQEEAHQVQNQLVIYFIDHGHYPNPTGSDDAVYCIGSLCTSGMQDTPVGPTWVYTMAMTMPKTLETSPFWTFLETKKAWAADYTVTGFSQFANMKSSVLYFCSQNDPIIANACPVDNAWVFTPTVSGNTTTWTARGAGETGTTPSGDGGDGTYTY
jgi:prepilin-type N-terminal cleavage/methylation domain-containing protein